MSQQNAPGRDEDKVDDPMGRAEYTDRLEDSGQEPNIGVRREPVEEPTAAEDDASTDEIADHLQQRDQTGDQRQ